MNTLRIPESVESLRETVYRHLRIYFDVFASLARNEEK